MIISLVIIQIGFFAVLFFILKVLFQKHLDSALKRLKQLQEEALIKEAHLQEELERVKKQKAAEVQKGREEAKRIIEEACQEAEKLRAEIEKKAKKDAEKFIAQGKESIDKLKRDFDSLVQVRALDFSTEIVKYTFTEKANENLQKQLINELIDEIEKIDKSRVSVSTNKANISTSIPLDNETRARLDKALSEKVGSKVLLIEEVSKDLITGLVVKMGKFVIDGSLKNKLRKAITYIKTK